MDKIFLQLFIFSILFTLKIFPQSSNNLNNQFTKPIKNNSFNNNKNNECNEIFNIKDYRRINFKQNNVYKKSKESASTIEGWENIMTDDFEGNFPSTKWNVYAATGYTDAYWGIVEASVGNHSVWCAASGVSAPVYGNGYADAMNAWMIYGPFDLSDASDATLDFYYYNSSEPGYDKFEWMASENGTNFSGYYLSDTSNSSQFQLKSFDLTNVPTLGDLTGKNGIYIAFIFYSDSLISNYWGALVDNIVLKKYTNVVYPATISLNKSFSFIDPTKSSSYRMLGLPGISNTSLGSIITGTQKTDWNAYYDNGAAANYLDEYDGSSKFIFSPGKALWVLSKNAIIISKSVSTVVLTSNSYSIPLHSGWNIISNPFERNVSWSSVQTANGLGANSLIYSWNGTWSNPSIMSVYEGYYFNNTQGLLSLSIPYDPNGALGKDNFIKIPINSESKSIELELYDSDKILSKVHISINPESSNDFDEFDYFAPPGDFDEVRVEIINTKLSTDYKKLFIESRPKIINGQKFDLNIINHSNSQVTLKVKGLEKFKDNEVYIVNSRSHKYYNLKLSNVVNIKPSTTDNYFLLLGDDNFIKESNVNLLKRDFSLSQNYPNPFNPTTTIEYSLLRKSNVRLIIYNSIGEVIRQFLNNIQETGNYKIDFNGAYLPSGIYFYQLNAVSVDGSSNFHDAKKMLLIK